MWLTGGVYDEWARFLDAWGRGEADALSSLPIVDPEALTEDTVQRLNARLAGALQARLDRWNAALTADLGTARELFAWGRALTQARTGLRELRRLADHPSLPEQMRKALADSIDTSIRNVQDQVEQSVERQARTGGDIRFVESLRRVVRENRLTAVTTEAPAAPPLSFAPLGDRASRRVLPG